MPSHTRRRRFKQYAITRRLKSSKQIVVPQLSRSIKPGDDFYNYVNYKWLKTTTLVPSESSFGVSEEIERNIRNNLISRIKQLVANQSTIKDSDEKALAIFFKSGLYSNYHDVHDKTIKNMLSNIGCNKNSEDIAHTIGQHIAFGVSSPISIYLGRDINHPSHGSLTISTGSLQLPDSSYYTGMAPGKGQTLKQFESMLVKLGKHLGYDDLGKVATLEATVAGIWNKSQSDEPRMTTGAALAKKYSKIPWKSLWRGYGLDDWEKAVITCRCDTWLKHLNGQFKASSISDWIVQLRVHLLLHFAPLISSPVDDLYFKFFGKTLRGDKVKMTQENLLYYYISYLMVPSLSALYKSCCLTLEWQQRTRAFVDRIQASAMKRVQELDWLSPRSRDRTREKIRAISLEVSDIDSGTHYKLPVDEMSELDIIHNIILCGKALTDRDIYYAKNKTKHPPPGDAVYEVNAHYYNSGNRLVIPAAITLWPFYAGNKKIGWSYGGLGAVVGHEMLHAFDEDGKNYDEDGIYKPWWTVKDVTNFGKKTNALVRLFNNTLFMGRFVNGRNTLSENIADLGGLAIALDALKRYMISKGFSEEQKKKELEDFFISYAISWRTKERPQRSVYRLFTDVHAPAQLRVNLIVNQFDDFYEIFNVNPGDKLYIDPKDRISIF
jgi:putative endopeptidase